MLSNLVSTNRILRDLKDLRETPPAGISAWLPKEEQMSIVGAQVMGPENSPYASGLFQLQVLFPPRYPMEPPNVKFITKIYHPNIAHDGNICLSVLNMPPKGDWKPSQSLRTVLLGIQLLLAEPNPDDPLDADAAKELKAHPQLFRSRAAEWTRLHATSEAKRGAIPSTPTCAAASPRQPEASHAAPSSSTRAQQPQEDAPPADKKAPQTRADTSSVGGGSHKPAGGGAAVSESAAAIQPSSGDVMNPAKRPAPEATASSRSRLSISKRTRP